MRQYLFFLFVTISTAATGQWSPDPSLNNAVCNFAGHQMEEQLISDGAGGAIIVWRDSRNIATQADIYAQHVNASGVLLWSTDAVAICNAVSDQFSPRLVSDGAGGAIIAWYDNRAGNYDIYAQRINGAGVVQWTTDGVAVCTATGNQNAHQLLADGSGGAIIVWSDGRTGGPNADIYVQRVDASGAILWSGDGMPVSTAGALQNIPQIVSDGAGGAIISWEDWRNFSQSDIYAQRISSNGFYNWNFNGVVICSEPNFAHQYNSKIVSDGSGGAIICWLDNRNAGTNTDIYAQRINGSGVVQWISNGLAVCNASAQQLNEQMISDGAGGAIITWEDRRAGNDVYAQRINNSGAAQWTANGLAICNDPAMQAEPQLIPATSGGALIAWSDYRGASPADVYAQTINAGGTMQWTANGVPVSISSSDQATPALIPDGANGAIIAWRDSRTTIDYDIYASRLFANGTLPVQLLDFSLTLEQDKVTLQWKTENEINNKDFAVQRSNDGANWTTLDFVAAHSPGTGIQLYKWIDHSPLPGKSYYRLKQTDNDNRFEYSRVLTANREMKTMVTIYPNPVSDLLQVYFKENISNGSIELFNTTGKLLLKQPVVSGSSVAIKMGQYSPGMYMLSVSAGEKKEVFKILVK
jgi:hypothetical protein